jgi:hypothetical protein
VAEELYEPVPQQVSQGDILRVVPHSFLSPPLSKLRPIADNKYEIEPEPFSAFNEKQGERVLATCKCRIAILVTPDCEIDKPNRRWLVCPIKPISELSGSYQNVIRRNRVVAALFLPSYRDLFPDSYADFNQITTLEPAFIQQAEGIVSLSDLGRIALYKQYIRWFTRWTLQEITCPHCMGIFDPTITLPVRNP